MTPDTSNMIFDPMADQSKFMADQYKDLDRVIVDDVKVFREWPKSGLHGEYYKSFNVDDLDLLVRYAILFIDPESPFGDYTNFDQRKRECIRLLEIHRENPVYGLIQDQTPHFDTIMFEYFKIVHKFDYEMWFSEKMSFHNDTAFIRKRPDPMSEDYIKITTAQQTVKGKLRDAEEELMKLEARLFKDDRLKRIIIKNAASDGLTSYAEMFALTRKY